jgi:hypothetical protein
MNGRRGHSEVLLHVGFSGRSSVNLRVVIDEGQKLSLPWSVSLCHRKVPIDFITGRQASMTVRSLSLIKYAARMKALGLKYIQ